MTVLVVRVRCMGVRVPHGLMDMFVAVGAGGHEVVRVAMVPVRVVVSVLMLHPFVLVLVAMVLKQVQEHAQSHQEPCPCHEPSSGAVAQRQGSHSADEGGASEDRACPRRAEAALGQEVEAQ